MANSYLDQAGLAHLWNLIKAKFSTKAYQTLRANGVNVTATTLDDTVEIIAGGTAKVAGDAANKSVTISSPIIKENGTTLTPDSNHTIDITAVTGVKGNSESSYRTGQVNITAANIGLGNVNNTADANKSVASAATLTTPRNINGVSFNGSSSIYFAAECSTAAGTTTKAVTITGYTPVFNTIIGVTFTNTGTSASAASLQVNDDSARSIYRFDGSTKTSVKEKELIKGQTYLFAYTREYTSNNQYTYYWVMVNYDKDTTYSSLSAAASGTAVSLVTTGEKYTWNQKTSNTGTVTQINATDGLHATSITTSGTLKAALTEYTKSSFNSISPADNVYGSTRQYSVCLDKSGCLAVRVPWGYSKMSQTQADAGSSTDGMVISPSVLKTTIDNAIAAAEVGAVMFQGTVTSYTTISGSAYKAGWYWLVGPNGAGTYAGQSCEPGDMIFAVSNKGSSAADSDFTVVQNNMDMARITETWMSSNLT